MTELEARPAPSPLVELVAGAFAEVLGTARVGPDDNFFWSSAAIRSSRPGSWREPCGGRGAPACPLRALFEAPTPAALPSGSRPGGGGEVPPLPIAAGPGGGVARASLGQQRFWILERPYRLGNSGSLIHLAVRVRGRTGPSAAGARAGVALAARHEPLRASLAEREGEIAAPAAAAPAAWPLPDAERARLARRAEGGGGAGL